MLLIDAFSLNREHGEFNVQSLSMEIIHVPSPNAFVLSWQMHIKSKLNLIFEQPKFSAKEQLGSKAFMYFQIHNTTLQTRDSFARRTKEQLREKPSLLLPRKDVKGVTNRVQICRFYCQ